MAKILAGFIIGGLYFYLWFVPVYFGWGDWWGLPPAGTVILLVATALLIRDNWDK